SYWELALQGDGQALWIPIALVGCTLAMVGWSLVAGPRARRPFVLLGTATAMTLQAFEVPSPHQIFARIRG
ncbi:MAG: hypothetical protein AAF525_20370, partial [Pseudomonadota bacterium]